MYDDDHNPEHWKHQVSTQDTRQGLPFIGGRHENDAATWEDNQVDSCKTEHASTNQSSNSIYPNDLI